MWKKIGFRQWRTEEKTLDNGINVLMSNNIKKLKDIREVLLKQSKISQQGISFEPGLKKVLKKVFRTLFPVKWISGENYQAWQRTSMCIERLNEAPCILT
jgi:hypothetical protein